MLQEIFTTLCLQYTSDAALIAKHWQQLQKNYSSKKRHYHNLQHIQAVLHHVDSVKYLFADYAAAVLATFYHDAVYNVLKHNNEQKSADLAISHLALMEVPTAIQQQCNELILATQHHALHTNHDCNYFTDADLSILGSAPKQYQQYTAAIRKEYAIYPDILYNNGRRKAMSHFLQMAHIFKTSFFQECYEQQARINIEWELSMLGG